jgi:hypothetical protein
MFRIKEHLFISPHSKVRVGVISRIEEVEAD